MLLNPLVNHKQFPPVHGLFLDRLFASVLQLHVHNPQQLFVQQQFQGVSEVETESDLGSVHEEPALGEALLDDGFELLVDDALDD